MICNNIPAQDHARQNFNLNDYNPFSDGTTDDTPAFGKLFDALCKAGGGVAIIPPGDYFLEGKRSIQIGSNTTVFSYGANFYLPKELGDRQRLIFFEGEDIINFFWFGGYFQGYCFNPELSLENTWEPNVNTRIIVIRTSVTGKTDNISFKDISSEGIAGSVINVNGHHERESGITNFATNISVENCSFINSGKFMWDYGYLWQIVVYNELYSDSELAMANKYFNKSHIVNNISLKEGQSKIFLDNLNPVRGADLIVRKDEHICLFNDELPGNLKRGKRYYVVNSTESFIEISDKTNGEPIVFSSSGGQDIRLMKNATVEYYRFAPEGDGPGKGSIDLVACKNTLIRGCKMSAYGDAMHVYRSQDNIISNNHIIGARMGAFFLAEYCKNSTITGNIVEGKNGSRILSIEKSNENVTVTGNLFKGGGRGAWINQPKNLIIQGNIFVNNTNKGTKDEMIGRRNIIDGEWQVFPEIYFTTYEENSEYGPVILRDNIFETSSDAAAAIQFEKNGKNIEVEGNFFNGANGEIWMDENDITINIGRNQGAVIKKGQQYSKPMFRNSL